MLIDAKSVLESGLLHDCVVRYVRMPHAGRSLAMRLAWVRGWEDDDGVPYAGQMDAHRLHAWDFQILFRDVSELKVAWHAKHQGLEPVRSGDVFFTDATVTSSSEVGQHEDQPADRSVLHAEMQWSPGGTVDLTFKTLELTSSDVEATVEWFRHPLLGPRIFELIGGIGGSHDWQAFSRQPRS